MALAVLTTSPDQCVSAFSTNARVTASALGSSASQGVSIQYQGGHNCANEPAAVSLTTLDIQCDESQLEPHGVQVLSGTGSCGFRVSFKSSAGCPVPFPIDKIMSPFALVVLILAGLVVLYLGVGMAYNGCVRGASGIEAIPNIDMWRRCCGACCTRSAGGGAPTGGFYAEFEAEEDGGDPSKARP